MTGADNIPAQREILLTIYRAAVDAAISGNGKTRETEVMLDMADKAWYDLLKLIQLNRMVQGR